MSRLRLHERRHVRSFLLLPRPLAYREKDICNSLDGECTCQPFADRTMHTLPVVHLTAAAGPKSLFPEKRERKRERTVVNALVWTLCSDRRLFASYALVIRDVLPRYFIRFYFVLSQNILSDSRLAYETVVDKSSASSVLLNQYNRYM